MKLCPKCNSANKDNAVMCKYCGFSLTSANLEVYQSHLDEINKLKEKSHKRNMLLHHCLLVTAGLLYLYLYIKAIPKGGFFKVTFLAVLLPLLAYLGIHHPRVLFTIGHLFTIDNIDDVELSDWYIFGNKAGGLLLIILAFALLLALVFG